MAILMKIIYGITKSNFGGAQRYVFDLALEAKKAGHETAVICGGNGELTKRLEGVGIRIINLPHLKRDVSIFADIASFFFISKTLLKERPDVFHTNSAKMGGLGNLAAKLSNISKPTRIIFTAHGYAWNEPRPFWQRKLAKFFTWLTILISDKTICVSEETRKQISKFPIIQNKLVVIRNGIEEFHLLDRREARAKLNLNDDGVVVGTLAELHRVKGLDYLIKAWHQASIPNGKLCILGEGEERKKLEKLIEKLGVSDSVLLKGFVLEGKQCLKAFDIFVLPSRSEALPYSILEAGYASLGTIASKVGGIPEIIEEGVSGILLEPGDIEGLKEAMLRLSYSSTERELLGSNLEKKVKDFFSVEKMARDTFGAYAKI